MPFPRHRWSIDAGTAATGAAPLVIGKSLGSLAASVSVLGQVLTAVEEFLDHAVWPHGD